MKHYSSIYFFVCWQNNFEKKYIYFSIVIVYTKNICIFVYTKTIDMTTQEKIYKINEINFKYDQNYQLNNSGRIFTIFMGKKQWCKFNELIERWEQFERERNADINVKATCLFIEENGGECTYKSMYGAKYYDFKGYKVRISNHDWTSDRHLEPDINLCSYEENGHIEMINKLKTL